MNFCENLKISDVDNSGCPSLKTMYVFATINITVAANYLLQFVVPDNELLVRMLPKVGLVDVHSLARAAARLAKRQFPQPSNLLHSIGRIVGVADEDAVAAKIGVADKLVVRQFRDYLASFDRCNYIFHL